MADQIPSFESGTQSHNSSQSFPTKNFVERFTYSESLAKNNLQLEKYTSSIGGIHVQAHLPVTCLETTDGSIGSTTHVPNCEHRQ